MVICTPVNYIPVNFNFSALLCLTWTLILLSLDWKVSLFFSARLSIKLYVNNQHATVFINYNIIGGRGD